MFHKRRLIAFICLVALLLAALTPVTSSPHDAVLVPVDPLFWLVVIGPAALPTQSDSYRFPLLEIAGPRPPPAL